MIMEKRRSIEKVEDPPKTGIFKWNYCPKIFEAPSMRVLREVLEIGGSSPRMMNREEGETLWVIKNPTEKRDTKGKRDSMGPIDMHEKPWERFRE